jgi:hypothetical protein
MGKYSKPNFKRQLLLTYECTQLCTPIDNNKGVEIIKELYKQEMLKNLNLSEPTLKNNNSKLIYTKLS